jgi:hypothetical protein
MRRTFLFYCPPHFNRSYFQGGFDPSVVDKEGLTAAEFSKKDNYHRGASILSHNDPTVAALSFLYAKLGKIPLDFVKNLQSLIEAHWNTFAHTF